MAPETSDDAELLDGVVAIYFWQDEPDYEDAWWWDDDWEGPTEEP